MGFSYEKTKVYAGQTKGIDLTCAADSDWVIYDKERLLIQEMQLDSTKAVEAKKTAIDKMIISLNEKIAQLEYADKLADEKKKSFLGRLTKGVTSNFRDQKLNYLTEIRDFLVERKDRIEHISKTFKKVKDKVENAI